MPKVTMPPGLKHNPPNQKNVYRCCLERGTGDPMTISVKADAYLTVIGGELLDPPLSTGQIKKGQFNKTDFTWISTAPDDASVVIMYGTQSCQFDRVHIVRLKREGGCAKADADDT